ncbi:hypothetical protein [Kitasatospora cathayae]|uniref:Uncharacterized protein n=1 Tax=Kitasatospora cathayae TaxID=3004092 RepID=A0ABY7QE61_9ACTN|nr:hypothetical protein [Kitasatospora sp. HUAS 3-15]WBP91050.1 hypothetical protein O1G21_37735 [Kitasatospora sp. HUAS 3-15]
MAVHHIDPAEALASLRTAREARAAARPRPLPGWYPATAAGLFALGFVLLGLLVLLPQRLWLADAGLRLIAAAALIGHVVVSHRIEHRPGIVPALPRGAARRRAIALQLLPLVAAGALALAFGAAGFLLTLGLTGGFGHLLLLRRKRARADAE